MPSTKPFDRPCAYIDALPTTASGRLEDEDGGEQGQSSGPPAEGHAERQVLRDAVA